MGYRVPDAVQCFPHSSRSPPLGWKLKELASRHSPRRVVRSMLCPAPEPVIFRAYENCRLFPRRGSGIVARGERGRWTLGLASLAIALLLSTTTITKAGGNVTEGEKVFQRCASCHVVIGSDPARKGPSLQSIVGRPVASIAGFDYSPNMIALGATGARWDEATLDQFLKYPSEFVKGTEMTAPPVRRESERVDLIAFLGTLR